MGYTPKNWDNKKHFGAMKCEWLLESEWLLLESKWLLERASGCVSND